MHTATQTPSLVLSLPVSYLTVHTLSFIQSRLCLSLHPRNNHFLNSSPFSLPFPLPLSSLPPERCYHGNWLQLKSLRHCIQHWHNAHMDRQIISCSHMDTFCLFIVPVELPVWIALDNVFNTYISGYSTQSVHMLKYRYNILDGISTVQMPQGAHRAKY